MAEESVDYKNIIDDIIKNEDEDKLNSLVKEVNLDSSLIDYILLKGEEIEEWGDYGSLVCHKDLNLANKRAIIDHEGDLFICDNNGKKLILLTTTFHKEEFKCCIKNHTCTKELLIEIVEKILNNISEFENADELLKLVAQHPNTNDELLMKLHETQNGKKLRKMSINVPDILNSVFGPDEYPDYGTPASDIREYEYELEVTHEDADWIENEGLGCYRPDPPDEEDYNKLEKEVITISCDEYLGQEYKEDFIAHFFTEDLEDGAHSKEELENWINSSIAKAINFFNNFTVMDFEDDENKNLYLNINIDKKYTLDELNEDWTADEYDITGFDELKDSQRIRIF